MRFDVMPVATEKQILEASQDAQNICRNYYKEIFPKDQLEYMLKLYHSKEAVKKQIEQGYIHMMLLLDGETIGYMEYYIQNDCLYLPRLYIKPEYRRRGFAKRAIERLENIFRSPEHGYQHITRIRRNLARKNKFAIAVYERMGFKKIKSVNIDIGHGFVCEDYIMEKIIQPKKVNKNG